MGDVVRENSAVRLAGTQNKKGRDGSRLGSAAGVEVLGGGKEGASAAASPKTSRHVAVLLVSVDPFVTRSEPVTQPFGCSTPAAADYRLSLTCPPIFMMCNLQQRDGTKGLPPKCPPPPLFQTFSLLDVPSLTFPPNLHPLSWHLTLFVPRRPCRYLIAAAENGFCARLLLVIV